MLSTTRPVVPPFTWTCDTEDGVLTVRPDGELDLSSAPLLDADVRSRDRRALVVDLRGLTFIDSAGVHLLLRWATDAARRGQDFRLIPGAERVQWVFAITGVMETLGLDRPRLVP